MAEQTESTSDCSTPGCENIFPTAFDFKGGAITSCPRCRGLEPAAGSPEESIDKTLRLIPRMRDALRAIAAAEMQARFHAGTSTADRAKGRTAWAALDEIRSIIEKFERGE